MPSKPSDTKLLNFDMIWYRHVEDSRAAQLVPVLDSAYSDGPIDVSGPYDVSLLRSTSKTVRKLAWMMPQILKCHTTSACKMTSPPLTTPASLTSHYT